MDESLNDILIKQNIENFISIGLSDLNFIEFIKNNDDNNSAYRYVYLFKGNPVAGKEMAKYVNNVMEMFEKSNSSVMRYFPGKDIFIISNNKIDNNTLAKYKMLREDRAYEIYCYLECDVKKIIDDFLYRMSFATNLVYDIQRFKTSNLYMELINEN